MESNELETILFPDAGSFDLWLEANNTRHEGIWIKMAKQNSGVPSITSNEATDIGLCWGWISSHRKGLDDIFYLQKYTPRRPKSKWSKVNLDKVIELTAKGLIREPGQIEIDLAKADGRWEASKTNSMYSK